MITGQNFIGFKRSATGKKKYKTFNPHLNEENEWEFTEADINEINEAVALAASAFKIYQNASSQDRAIFLNTIADSILDLGDELINVYCKETSLAEGRAKGERGRTVGQLRAFADHLLEGAWINATIETADATRVPGPKPDLRKINVAMGPIAVFGASNFPLAFSAIGGDSASALAAGCPVIVKSHPMHAATSELIATAVINAAKLCNMPNGVFSLLNSSDNGVGEALVLHPDIKAVGFTGSLKGGRALHDLGALRPEPIPVFAEMGSINPIIILPRAMSKKDSNWANMISESITMGSGQFCTNPGLIIALQNPELSAFTTNLSNVLMQAEPSCMLHPNIESTYTKKTSDLLSNKDVEIIVQHKGQVNKNYAQPVLVKVNGTVFIQDKKLQDEVFGPFSMIVSCKDVTEMEKVIKSLDGQLTGTIISEGDEINDYQEVVSLLANKVGRILFNGVPTGVEVSPAMVHGGPYPASTDSRFTAVGTDSIKRWVRPFCFQDWPNELLPKALQNKNVLGIRRQINGKTSIDDI